MRTRTIIGSLLCTTLAFLLADGASAQDKAKKGGAAPANPHELSPAETTAKCEEFLRTVLQSSPKEDLRREVAAGLSDVRDPRAVDLLRLALADGAGVVRRVAIHSLAAEGDPSVIPLIGPL